MLSIKTIIRQSTLPLLETHMLLQQVLGVSRAWLIAHDDSLLTGAERLNYQHLLDRRVSGEPMAYILGYKEFFGHEFKVNNAVLVPRPETELLVQSALDFIVNIKNPKILDLGTGSGVIAISIALARPDAVIVATDHSEAALQIAQMNAQTLGVRLNFTRANWYDVELGQQLTKKHFDLIVSNPPYISERDSHLQQGDLRFEPKIALTDYADGFAAIRNIVKYAPDYLAVKGAVYIEHGWDQAATVKNILGQHNFNAIQTKQDLAGIDRITYGLYQA